MNMVLTVGKKYRLSFSVVNRGEKILLLNLNGSFEGGNIDFTEDQLSPHLVSGSVDHILVGDEILIHAILKEIKEGDEIAYIFSIGENIQFGLKAEEVEEVAYAVYEEGEEIIINAKVVKIDKEEGAVQFNVQDAAEYGSDVVVEFDDIPFTLASHDGSLEELEKALARDEELVLLNAVVCGYDSEEDYPYTIQTKGENPDEIYLDDIELEWCIFIPDEGEPEEEPEAAGYRSISSW